MNIGKGKTLMQRLLEAGYPKEEMYSHESDLYIYVTPLTRKVIDQWCKDNNFNREYGCPIFHDQITGRAMYDCAFCNDDWWNQKASANLP